MTAKAPSQARTVAPTQQRSVVYGALIGLTSLVIVLQGLWAGVFLQHDGERDASTGWIDLHARGADLSIVLAAAATLFAFVKLRDRRDLWLGSGILTLLLVGEAYIGGLIRDDGKDALTIVHLPLAMSLVGLVVWLTSRVVRRR